MNEENCGAPTPAILGAVVGQQSYNRQFTVPESSRSRVVWRRTAYCGALLDLVQVGHDWKSGLSWDLDGDCLPILAIPSPPPGVVPTPR
jgi:hypothetical protein